MLNFIAIIGWLLGLVVTPASGAVGCSLANPDSDIRRFFPEMSHYDVNYVSFENQNPNGLIELELALGDDLEPVYETADVPFTLYTVTGPQGRLGYVFGTNQKGEFSNIQVIAVTNSDLSLREIYIQRLRSPYWETLQGDEFLSQLSSLPLESFPDFSACYSGGDCADVPVTDPTNGAATEDYRAILRAVAKLHLISIHLLRPGTPPNPINDHARAEWIGNTRGAGLNLDVLQGGNKYDRSSADAYLSPDDSVFVWRVGSEVRGYPFSILERYPVIEDSFIGGDVSVVLAGLHGNPVVLERSDNFHMRPTMDTLYGGRLFVDLDTGAVWSPVLARPVYGGATESLRVGRGGVTMPWALAREHFPGIEVLLERGLVTSSNVGGEILVVRDSSFTEGWRVSDLTQGVNHVDVGQTGAVLFRVGDNALVWQASVDNIQLHFETLNQVEFIDVETGSTWSGIRGECISGPLQGSNLLPMVQMRMSEFEWLSHFED